MLITSLWPEALKYNDIRSAEFQKLVEFVTEVRFVIGELPNRQKYNLLYESDSLIADNANLLCSLTNLHEVAFSESPKGLRIAITGRDAWIDINEDTLNEHKTNLEMRISKTRLEITNLEGRLDNKSYIEKAPQALVEQTQKELKQKRDLLASLMREIDIIK